MTVGSKAAVYKGNADRTSGGLTKSDIVRKKVGTTSKGKPAYRYVSKLKSSKGKKNSWILAVQAAKKSLGYKKHEMAFPKKGSDLYKEAMNIHKGKSPSKKSRKPKK